MRKLFFMLLTCFSFIACQKGIHWDIASVGFLVKDNTGNCLPVTINGSYIADSITNDDNFITVDVNVTSIGTYNIYTDSINGYVFKASGNFDNSGIHHVKLLGNGKPLMADTDHFIIHYDTSICETEIAVNSNAIPPAKFSLQGAPGECLNDSIIGNYVKGAALDTSNKISISVNVSSAGRYNISTDTVNGYSFKASGVFANVGIQQVILFPNGLPVNDGVNVFNLTGDSSSCNLNVKVNSDEAEFTLKGSPGKCMDDSVIGTYIPKIPLDTFSKVNIKVDVSLAGKYNISTNILNGYSFHSAGVFDKTGIQTITMYANGIPVNAETDVFNVSSATSACSFEVNVLSDIIVGTGDDYLPLTQGNYWIYEDLFHKGLTIKRTADNDSTVKTKIYRVLHDTDKYGLENTFLFRRDNANYLDYSREDRYTNSMQYSSANFIDLKFLDQYVQQGNSWASPEFSDTTTFGQVIVLKYTYTCTKSNGVVTVNGKAFANVCIIEMRPLIHSLKNPWSTTNEVYTYYYAKGIGLIYYHAINNFGYLAAEMQIQSWHVQ